MQARRGPDIHAAATAHASVHSPPFWHHQQLQHLLQRRRIGAREAGAQVREAGEVMEVGTKLRGYAESVNRCIPANFLVMCMCAGAYTRG